MIVAILILLAMPFSDLSKLRGNQFKPISKFLLFSFGANFLILMALGAKHVETPFIEFGQISTALYFSYFIVLLPLAGIIENTVVFFSTEKSSKSIVSSTLTVVVVGVVIYLFSDIFLS